MNRERRCSAPCSGTCIRASTRHLRVHVWNTAHPGVVVSAWSFLLLGLSTAFVVTTPSSTQPSQFLQRHARSSSRSRKITLSYIRLKDGTWPGQHSVPRHRAESSCARVCRPQLATRRQRADRHEEAARCHRCCMRETTRETPRQREHTASALRSRFSMYPSMAEQGC